MDFTLVRSPLKRISNMASGFDKRSEGLFRSVRHANFRKFDLGCRSETGTSVGSVNTDIGLSEFDAIVEQYPSVGQFGESRFPVANVNIEMSRREVSIAQRKSP